MLNNDDIRSNYSSQYIEVEVVAPINQALNGMKPSSPLTSEYSQSRIRWYQERNYHSKAKEAIIIRRESVEGRIEMLRQNGYGRQLSDALLPLYRELLFHPKERMLDQSHLKQDNPESSLLRRQEATQLLRSVLQYELHLSELFADGYIIDYLEDCIFAEEKKYHHKGLFFRSMMASILDGYTPDWDKLYSIIKPELTKIPKNFKRIKIEYCCRMMAVIMIMRNQALSSEAREKLLSQLCDENLWEIIAYQYSILLGVVIISDFKNVIEIIGLFSNAKKQYAHLLCTCVSYRPSILRVNDLDKQKKYNRTYEKLVEACKEEQSTELDDLFRVIFPDTTLKDYANDSVKLTTAETQRRLEEQQTLIMEQTKLINDQKIEISELRLYREVAEKMSKSYADDVISIDELKQAINSIIDPEKALQFYFQLNYILRKNAAWKKHSDEIGDLIEAKSKSQTEVALDRQTEVIKQAANALQAVANKPTHYYAEGAKHYDNSKQLNIMDSAAEDGGKGRLIE